jgi:hypothetical protein
MRRYAECNYAECRFAECLGALHHPPDGITNPKYKLLCFLTTKFFCKEKKVLVLTGIGAAN